MLEIQAVKLFHGRLFRHGKLQNDSMTIRFQHPVDFGKPLFSVFKVSYAKTHRDDIETVVVKRQRGSISQSQFNLILKALLLDLFFPDFHHFFGNVHADDVGLGIVFGQGDGKVGRACGKVKDGFWQKVEEAKTWGSDLINNFIAGIKEGWESLKDTVGQTAESIAAYLGFSEPEEGPLSNFHTYAPDMMKLYAQGITDNADLVTDALNNATADLMNTNVDVGMVRTIQTNNDGITPSGGDEFGSIAALLEEFISNFKQDIYLDTGALVGATAGAYNVALGQLATRGGRR